MKKNKLFTKDQVKELVEALSSEKLATHVDKWKKEFEKDPEKFGTFKIIVTTDDVDRSGDSVNIDGWELGPYLKNPVVLWSHDYHGLPVGVTMSLKKEGNGLVAEGFFAPEEANPHAQHVRKLYDLGMVNTASVGFIPKEFDPKDDTKILKQELLEWSFVPVPANSEALNLLKEYGQDIEKWCGTKEVGDLISKGLFRKH